MAIELGAVALLIGLGDHLALRPVSPTGLYPRTASRPTESHAEHALYRALSKRLPEG